GDGGRRAGLGPQHHEEVVLRERDDQVAQLAEPSDRGGQHRRQLVDGPFGAAHSHRAELLQIAREGGLRHPESFPGEGAAEALLRADPLGPEQPADGLVTRALALDDLQGPHGEMSVPTPLSVNSSPMMLWGTRPSMRWTRATPLCSALRMERAFTFIPPEMVPSSIWAASSVACSSSTSPPDRKIPTTS